MKVITLITEVAGYQVKMQAHEEMVKITILTVDQKDILYYEQIQFMNPKIAWDYADEFTKADCKKLVKRYLRYDPKEK